MEAARDGGAASPSPAVLPSGIDGAAGSGGRKLSSFERHMQGGLPYVKLVDPRWQLIVQGGT